MSGTYTLAEIHERHEKLEALAADVASIRLHQTNLSVQMVSGAALGPELMDAINEDFETFLEGALERRESRMAGVRTQLKLDATAAYVAFMGGE